MYIEPPSRTRRLVGIDARDGTAIYGKAAAPRFNSLRRGELGSKQRATRA